MLNIVFMGTPEFAVPALQGLLDSEHKVVAIYSQPPRPAGRGQQLRKSPVHELAETHGVPVLTPKNFKNPEDVAALRAHGVDVAVVAAYGLLLPPAVLEAFPKGCINIHPSLLPRWRGAAPIHRTVLAGDRKTGICIMQMDEGLDTGAVLAREHILLPTNITTGALHDMLAERAVPLLLDVLSQVEAGTAKTTPQSEDGVTYATKISKEESRINWQQSAQVIDRQIRGLNPYPAASAILNGEQVKILEAEIVEGTGEPGTVLDDLLTVACGEGAIRPRIIQRAGKRPMTAEECLRGFPVLPGTKLG